jgi:hypothetical protein
MLSPPPMPAIYLNTEGLSSEASDLMASAMTEAAGESAEIGISTGGVRGADLNAIIARAQANQGRDPFWFPPAVVEELRGRILKALGVNSGARGAIYQGIGNVMLTTIQANVDNQRGPGGVSFRALTPEYAKRKQRKFGFITPILRATGDLMAGLKIVITKGY